MLQKTEAIILNKIQYNDNTNIINLYSLEFGKISLIAKRYKNKKIDNHIPCIPLSIVDIEINIKKTRNIQTINSINSRFVLHNISNNIYKLSIAQFIAEVVLKTVKEEEQNISMYHFIKDTIISLEECEGSLNLINLFFLIQFAKIIGFEMTNNYNSETPFFNLKEGMYLPFFTCEAESIDQRNSKILSLLLSVKETYIAENIKLNYNDRISLLNHLLCYYKIHVHNFGELRTIQVFNEIFH